jgi:hypothetical protein
MTKADRASVGWDSQKKAWRIRIQIGEEVIKRETSGHKLAHDAADDILRSAAIEVAQADGYSIEPAAVFIER